ncbi:ABC transporter permease [Nakamurella endophytica]|uniref:ABC transmembrane type-1 domain-containing protein n=1 Tax=Nakamurella endophytica TaxID=1748367 RepID=A0A917WB98_9ACTN|nr:ABC transporter permease [Nakamurella endophytica]GGL86485.1 hypothetical protein GCM10011594_02640 [Nakamurella endophytica]
MLTFLARRLIASFFIILGATFIAYILMSYAGDPLNAAYNIQDPTQRAQAIANLTRVLHLDVPPVARYFIWLKGIGGCFVGHCDFGQNVQLQSVGSNLGSALGNTLKLVTAATVVAIVIGVTVGVITALRQYSGLDYTVSFLTFLFFSLPVFWVGILLKEVIAIKYNDFLQGGAHYNWAIIIVVSLIIGFLAYSLVGGAPRRKLLIGAAAAVVAFALNWYMSATAWLLDPRLGIVVVGILALCIAYGMTALMAGTANRKALYSALTTAVLGIVLYQPLQYFFYNGMNFLKLLGLLVVAVIAAVVIGYLFGGDDRGLSARTAAFTAVLVGLVIFVDRLMRAWQTYSNDPAIGGRPLATTNPSTPNLDGDFWIQTLDTVTHLILPTLTLMLISLAGYSRYSRASMLEVLNQDYIRTARSKGLTERTVIVRHAFRNALIPLATVLALDVGALIGGAVLTETVFGWKAMGSLFQDGLTNYDPNPVMAFFLITALVAVVFNILADLAYAALDPRIRVGSA